MYYIFKTQMVQWQGINLHAELQNELTPEWYTKYDWWEGKPLAGLLPALTFSIHSNAPFVDNYFTGNQFNLYSARLIDILDQSGMKHEIFPVSMVDQETNGMIEHTYQLFHLLEIDPAIDMEKSIIAEDMLNPHNVREIHRLVLTEEFIKRGRMLTRIKEIRHLTLIHETLKNALEEVKITGCSFIPIEEFSLGLNIFLQKLRNRISPST